MKHLDSAAALALVLVLSASAAAAALRKLKRYGVNVLRVWCQWDNKRGFVDAGPTSTTYETDGGLRAEPLATLKAILTDAARERMVIEPALFSRESCNENVRLPDRRWTAPSKRWPATCGRTAT